MLVVIKKLITKCKKTHKKNATLVANSNTEETIRTVTHCYLQMTRLWQISAFYLSFCFDFSWSFLSSRTTHTKKSPLQVPHHNHLTIHNLFENLFQQQEKESLKKSDSLEIYKNNNDLEYPWCFKGRLWFRPAIVKIPNDESLRPPTSILSLFGYTVGGVVALEYDESPIGPYREYVTMGALVSKRGAIGQWGSKLYVSTKEAANICEDIWGVPATFSNIQYDEESSSETDNLFVTNPPPKNNEGSRSSTDDKEGNGTLKKKRNELMIPFLLPKSDSSDAINGNKDTTICVSGWKNTRVLTQEELQSAQQSEQPPSLIRIPVFWTPTIKALWAPFVPLPKSEEGEDADSNGGLNLHKLRLSASALRLRFCGQDSSELLGVPLGLGLVVDNVLIEIGEKWDEL